MTGTYRLNWDTAEHRLEIACRGVWDAPVMRQFDQDFRATLTTLPRSGWTLLADLRGTGGWAPDLHSVVADLMTISRDQGMTQGAVVVSKTVGPAQKRHAPTAYRASSNPSKRQGHCSTRPGDGQAGP